MKTKCVNFVLFFQLWTTFTTNEVVVIGLSAPYSLSDLPFSEQRNNNDMNYQKIITLGSRRNKSSMIQDQIHFPNNEKSIEELAFKNVPSDSRGMKTNPRNKNPELFVPSSSNSKLLPESSTIHLDASELQDEGMYKANGEVSLHKSLLVSKKDESVLINGRRNVHGSITKRSQRDDSGFVFPNQRYLPDVGKNGPNCANGSTFCEQTKDYPR